MQYGGMGWKTTTKSENINLCRTVLLTLVINNIGVSGMVKDEAEEGRILQYSQITTVEQFFRLTFKTNDQQPSIPKKH